MKRAVSEIESLNSRVLVLVSALSSCESARIIPPSPSQAPPVSPLDMLSRGYMGEAVSELVNTLRLHSNDICRISDALNAARNQLIADVKSEVNLSLLECISIFSQIPVTKS